MISSVHHLLSRQSLLSHQSVLCESRVPRRLGVLGRLPLALEAHLAHPAPQREVRRVRKLPRGAARGGQARGGVRGGGLAGGADGEDGGVAAFGGAVVGGEGERVVVCWCVCFCVFLIALCVVCLYMRSCVEGGRSDCPRHQRPKPHTKHSNNQKHTRRKGCENPTTKTANQPRTKQEGRKKKKKKHSRSPSYISITLSL